MLFPQQLQRHALAAQLAMDGRPVRQRALISRNDDRRREETRLQHLVAEIIRQWPDEPGTLRTAEIIDNRALADAEAGTDLPARQPGSLQAQNIA